MNVSTLLAELEEEQGWREEEIRFFQNQGTLVTLETRQDQFRRALILLLYAHLEGFCKFAFALYVKAVNGEKIKCGEANYAIAASSLADVFQALRDPQRKSDLFRRELPDDSQLHRFARDHEFVEQIAAFSERLVNIPDNVVDTESNLSPSVLRKNLYRLGLPHDLFAALDGHIHRLRNYRHEIAHGETKAGVAEKEYTELKEATFKIMNEVKHETMRALREKHYLRA